MLLLQQEDWGSVPSRLSSEASLLSPHHVTPEDLSASPRTEGYSICHPCSYHLNVLPSFLSGTSGGKLNPPPAPPARSPTTELSSRSQQAPAWTPAPLPGGQLRNGSLHITGKWGPPSATLAASEEMFPWLRVGVSQPPVMSFQRCATQKQGAHSSTEQLTACVK